MSDGRRNDFCPGVSTRYNGLMSSGSSSSLSMAATMATFDRAVPKSMQAIQFKSRRLEITLMSLPRPRVLDRLDLTRENYNAQFRRPANDWSLTYSYRRPSFQVFV